MEQRRSLFVGTIDLLIVLLILKGEVFVRDMEPIFYIIPIGFLLWFAFEGWKNLFARPSRAPNSAGIVNSRGNRQADKKPA